jgi:hypothetical protein
VDCGSLPVNLIIALKPQAATKADPNHHFRTVPPFSKSISAFKTRSAAEIVESAEKKHCLSLCGLCTLRGE